MDIGKALTFFQDDPRWKEKIGIGTGVVLASLILSTVLIGILGFFVVAGYCVRLLQNVRDGKSTPLPEWDQWGDDLVRGFKLAVVEFVWALPLILVGIPFIIGGIIADQPGRGAGALGGTILAAAGCLTFLYALFVYAVRPGYTLAYARSEKIADGLQIANVWHWTRNNIGQVIVVGLLVLVADAIIPSIASIIGTILCVVGLIVTMPLGTLATYLFRSHLYGQLGRSLPDTPASGGGNPFDSAYSSSTPTYDTPATGASTSGASASGASTYSAPSSDFASGPIGDPSAGATASAASRAGESGYNTATDANLNIDPDLDNPIVPESETPDVTSRTTSVGDYDAAPDANLNIDPDLDNPIVPESETPDVASRTTSAGDYDAAPDANLNIDPDLDNPIVPESETPDVASRTTSAGDYDAAPGANLNIDPNLENPIVPEDETPDADDVSNV